MKASLASLCAVALSLLLASPAAAGLIDVDTTADATVVNAQCSLREALTSANTNSSAAEPSCEAGDLGGGQDFIRLLQPGTYTLLGTAGENANATGDLDYTGNGTVVIQGPVDFATGIPTATIDAPASDRIIDVPSIAGTSGQLNLDQLTLTDGRALGALAEGDGGAIRFAVPNVAFEMINSRITGSQAGRNGGAISFESADVFSNLQVGFSEISGNAAGTQVAGDGGAIWTGATQPTNGPIVNASTLAGNSASGVGGAVALNAATAASMRFRNSTFSGNSAAAGASAIGYSGTGPGADSFFEFSTVADNTSSASHGAIASGASGHDFFLRGSIVSGNTGAGVPSNCSGLGDFISEGYNVESANSCSLVPANPDKINTDPMLAPLAISTVAGARQTARTRGLYDGSPAVNFVPRTPTDQCDDAFTAGSDGRAIPRPAAPAGFCDAGAFEGTVGPKPVPPASDPSPSTPAKPKKCKKGRKLKKGKCVKKRRKKK
jgi:CSLREA domain-containing protein